MGGTIKMFVLQGDTCLASHTTLFFFSFPHFPSLSPLPPPFLFLSVLILCYTRFCPSLPSPFPPPLLPSPEEDPVMRQFEDEVANEENLLAELQTASGIDQIITENEKLITEK